MDDAPRLLPCPFCGRDDERIICTSDGTQIRHRCRGWSDGPEVYASGQTIAQAANLWNQRAQSTITLNGVDYVTDEEAAAAVREARRSAFEEAAAHAYQLAGKPREGTFDGDDVFLLLTDFGDAIRDMDAEIERLRNVELRSADITIAERDATIADLSAKLAAYEGARTAADVQRARERVSPRFGETILPAMTIPDDGRVDAGMKELDWFETPMSLISSPPVADGIPEWSGADGGRDGA